MMFTRPRRGGPLVISLSTKKEKEAGSLCSEEFLRTLLGPVVFYRFMWLYHPKERTLRQTILKDVSYSASSAFSDIMEL